MAQSDLERPEPCSIETSKNPLSVLRRSSYLQPRSFTCASSRLPVPGLTRSAGIKLNARVWLRRHPDAVSLPHRAISPPSGTPPGKAVSDPCSAWRLCSMKCNRNGQSKMISSNSQHGSKLRKAKPLASAAGPAKQFLELQQLRKEVHELEHLTAMDRQRGATCARTGEQRRR
jgi:hypothetical protein